MSQVTTLIRKYPFSLLFTFIYTCLWIMIFSAPFRHPKGSIASGEAVMHGIMFASMIASISLVIIILFAIFKKEGKFYGYLAAYILLPVIVAWLGPYIIS